MLVKINEWTNENIHFIIIGNIRGHKLPTFIRCLLLCVNLFKFWQNLKQVFFECKHLLIRRLIWINSNHACWRLKWGRNRSCTLFGDHTIFGNIWITCLLIIIVLRIYLLICSSSYWWNLYNLFLIQSSSPLFKNLLLLRCYFICRNSKTVFLKALISIRIKTHH